MELPVCGKQVEQVELPVCDSMITVRACSSQEVHVGTLIWDYFPYMARSSFGVCQTFVSWLGLLGHVITLRPWVCQGLLFMISMTVLAHDRLLGTMSNIGENTSDVNMYILSDTQATSTCTF